MPLWDYMVGAMKYWVAEVGVDGYRCDFPGLVPEEFWFRATTELNAIKPVLMLAEDEDHSYLLERAFDMNYGWAHHHLMNAVAGGQRRPAALDTMMQYEMKRYDPGVIQAQVHDQPRRELMERHHRREDWVMLRRPLQPTSSPFPVCPCSITARRLTSTRDLSSSSVTR